VINFGKHWHPNIDFLRINPSRSTKFNANDKNYKELSVNLGIVIDSLSKSYQNGTETTAVLNNISLEIHDGEFVAIQGPSGSGKSTLMNIIGCLDRFNPGSYCLDGINISATNDNQRADIRNNKIGFVFQFFNLLPQYTALENVQLPLFYCNIAPKTAYQKAINALEMLGLKNRMHYWPNQLSGGQKQRVAIARAIINSPSIILADEPTGSLDTKTGREVMNILKELNSQKKTIVMVTHNLGLAKLADRIIQIQDGMIVGELS
jgi:putative ABC transport system ATP-binding protein